ncbi:MULTISPECIES: PilZ domain-containing protein [Clostridium]|uniref:PilZ domain-containing protein n=1 Tax=Clostridium TaxID=1485 RepID=UPI0009BDE2AA|nr:MULTISPECIES: PilZ domain-containing protein [Clostridium]
MRNFSEHRKFKRTKYKCTVNSFIVNGVSQSYNVEILDISESGARIHVPKQLNTGDKITFNFRMGALNITCNSTIIWGAVNSFSSGFINGCKFDIIAADKHLLKLFIDSLYNKKFISIYKDKKTYIIPNVYYTLDISNSDLYKIFQYATYQIGSFKKSTEVLDLSIRNNIVERLSTYLEENANCFKVSMYEYDQFYDILDFSIKSLEDNSESISALQLREINLSDFQSDRAQKYKIDFEKLPNEIKLLAIDEISKTLTNIG